MNSLRSRWLPIVTFLVFEAVAVALWLAKDNIFYLFNFSYIGAAVALGIFLFTKKSPHARRVTQLLVGLYMLVYLVAKIFGPLVFGRGWCGYACWTAMVLDFLPFKVPQEPRKKIGWIRYVAFAASLAFVAALFLAHVGNIERIMFWAFIVGNVAYYAIGIAMAYAFKDNRAFCKYVCPITVFLKPMSYFSLVRIKCDHSKCVSCGKCRKICPMNVDMLDDSRKRENGTECILCLECVKNCPKDAL